MNIRRRQLLTTGSVALAIVLLGAVTTIAMAFTPEKEASSELILEETLAETPLALEDIRQIRFSDMGENDSACDAARYMAARAVMQGVDRDRFDPHALVTRAELVTMLRRMAADDAEPVGSLPAYSDVTEDDWFADAVAWAFHAGIATGNADGSFAPRRTVTRTELAVMLSRFAEARGMDTTASGDLSQWTDGASVPAYAAAPMSWALERGVLGSMVTETIHGKLPVSRRQCAQILVALTAAMENEPLAVQIAEQDVLPPIVSASRDNHSRLQAAIDAAAAKYGAIGVQVAVIEGGQVTDAYASGWATKNVEKMTPQHKMRIASISKVIIGMKAMRLMERGIIDLDNPIGVYWGVSMKNPHYPNDPVTIRNLMTHTSSIFVAGDDVSLSYGAVRAKLSGGSAYRNVRPGNIGGWAYNNYGYSVLGMTLELAANGKMNDLLRRDLLTLMDIDAAFAPGDLRDSSQLVTLAYHGGGVARSAAKQREFHSPAAPGASGTYFAGGLTINVSDLGKLVALLANDGQYEGLQMMKPESVALMEAVNETQLPDGSYQGLSIRCRKDIYGRERLYFHTGSAYGVYNCMSYDPDTGDGVVVLTVGASAAKDSNGIYAVCGEISHEIYNATKK